MVAVGLFVASMPTESRFAFRERKRILCMSGLRWYMVAELGSFTVAMAAVVLLALVR